MAGFTEIYDDPDNQPWNTTYWDEDDGQWHCQWCYDPCHECECE